MEVKGTGLRPSPRAGHRLEVIGDYLCILGGKDEALKSRTVFHFYDSKSDCFKGFTTDDIHDDDEFETVRKADMDAVDMTGKKISKKNTSRDKKKSGKKTEGNNSEFTKTTDKNRSTIKRAETISPTKKQVNTDGMDSKSVIRDHKSALEDDASDRDASNLDDTKVFKARSLMSMKKDRINKIREREKRELLAEFEPAGKYKNMTFFDPDFQAMSNALKVIGMPSEKIRVTDRGLPILTPGVSRFGNPTTSKSKHIGMPKLDSFTFFTKDYLVFIFGGDRCGLCSNDFYVIDIEEPVTGKEGVVTKIDNELEEQERIERERQLLELDNSTKKNQSAYANDLSDSRNRTGHNFANEAELMDSPVKKEKQSPKRMATKVGGSSLKKQSSGDNLPTSPSKRQPTINEQKMHAMQDPNYSKQNTRPNNTSPDKNREGSDEQNLDIDQNDIEIN